MAPLTRGRLLEYLLLFVAVADFERAVFVQLQMEMVVSLAVVFVSAVKVDIGSTIRIDFDVFDAVRIYAVVGAIAPLEHTLKLSLDVPMLGGVREIPLLRHIIASR